MSLLMVLFACAISFVLGAVTIKYSAGYSYSKKEDK